jgi:hypothetical protein
LAWDCGVGHYFQVLIRCQLVLNIFPFPVSTYSKINRRSAANSCLRFAYFFLFPLCSANTIVPAIRSPPIGEAQRKKKSAKKLLIAAMNSPRFAYWRGEGAPLRLYEYNAM